MDLSNFFKVNQIVTLTATDKKMAIKELVDKLQDLSLIENKERFYAQIVHRESLENTGIGNSLAIPHTRTETVDSLITILGISEEGIDYQSFDEKPVNYILLNIFPTDMSTKYLYLIGMMARIFSNPEKISDIDSTITPANFYKFLSSQSEEYFESLTDKNPTEKESIDSLIGVPSSDLDLLIRLDRLFDMKDDVKNSEIIENKINGLKALIDKRSLAYYERMKKKRDNPFSVVEKNSCTGCHMGIPPVDLRQIRDRKGVPVCTHCGRFLILV